MKQGGFLLLLFFFVTLSYTQKNVHYDIEKGIDAVERQYINAWKKVTKVEGFRIQITSFSGVNSKTSIDRVATQFRQQFPDIPYDISYFEPSFRLRVGNYHTKLEAYRALEKIAPVFPGAFVLKDQVDF
ncbi:MAG: SPOR domain-containing protein [Bacteroidetes bacterium]|nr:SPOR domain-containing protein [Bacteroidota bacterium]MCL2303437.1 SPOR domain-containing protein [Lentimicrobiaceae bacterium]